MLGNCSLSESRFSSESTASSTDMMVCGTKMWVATICRSRGWCSRVYQSCRVPDVDAGEFVPRDAWQPAPPSSRCRRGLDDVVVLEPCRMKTTSLGPARRPNVRTGRQALHPHRRRVAGRPVVPRAANIVPDRTRRPLHSNTLMSFTLYEQGVSAPGAQRGRT
jgi:hypothetical protein